MSLPERHGGSSSSVGVRRIEFVVWTLASTKVGAGSVLESFG